LITNIKNSNKLFGFFLIQVSALLFFLITVPIRLAKTEHNLHPGEFTFYRFLIGLVFFSLVILKTPKNLKPNKIHLLIGRAAFNFISLGLMFYTVDYISASMGSILNMTFPLFVALLSFLFLDKKLDMAGYLSSLIAVTGIILTIPSTGSINTIGIGLGLLSGFSAALAIIFLGLAREHNSSETVLFYMFLGGFIFSYLVFREHITFNIDKTLFYLIPSAVFGVIAQYALTHSFKFITTVEASVTSTTRIIYAALLGGLLAGDPNLSTTNWIGVILIFLSSTFLAFRNSTTS